MSQRTWIYLILLPVSTGDSGNGGGGGNSSPSQFVPKERTQAKQAPDMCTGIQELYCASYNEDGSLRKENSAWITQAGMILLPNDRNDTNISYNDALPTKYIGGKPHVYYEGQWLEIYGHVHTQPYSAIPSNEAGEENDDFDFIGQFSNDVTGFIFGPNEVYRYQNDNTRIQKKIGNVGNFIGCEKAYLTIIKFYEKVTVINYATCFMLQPIKGSEQRRC